MKEDTKRRARTVLRLWRLLWDAFAFWSFLFAQGSLVSFRLALNVFVQGFFFWRQHDERQRVYASGFAACKKGCGWTSPNPMVGAVVVKEGRIIGQGWHQRYGQAHAERNALASCTEDPQGATLYVTLEPCCHYGKQPPCVDAILDAGIHRVVVGSADPNPLVAGKGIAILRAHGIDVTENVLQEECDALNKVFFHYITTKRPFVSMKYAMTMDGKSPHTQALPNGSPGKLPGIMFNGSDTDSAALWWESEPSWQMTRC